MPRRRRFATARRGRAEGQTGGPLPGETGAEYTSAHECRRPKLPPSDQRPRRVDRRRRAQLRPLRPQSGHSRSGKSRLRRPAGVSRSGRRRRLLALSAGPPRPCSGAAATRPPARRARGGRTSGPTGRALAEGRGPDLRTSGPPSHPSGSRRLASGVSQFFLRAPGSARAPLLPRHQSRHQSRLNSA